MAEKKPAAKAATKKAAVKTSTSAVKKAPKEVPAEIKKSKIEKADAVKKVEKAEVVKKVEKAEAVKKAEKSEAVKISGAVYATGKRKNSIARVYIVPGKGTFVVNGRPMAEYFKRKVLQLIVTQPFTVANVEGRFDVRAMATGGGLSGQAGAVRHGISKALQLSDSGLRGALKKAGFLTRDSRVVERKHFGHHKARRSTQFSKR
jgi:small subunit ribosomal protein S9